MWWKSGQNSWKSANPQKSEQNLWKPWQNPRKSGQTYWKYGKNGVQHALFFKKLAPNVCRITWKLYFIPKTVFMRKIRTKSGTKFFRPSLRKFGQKSFASPKICLLLLLWPMWPAHCTRGRFILVVSCNDDIAVHSCPFFALQRQAAKLVSG